MKLVSLGLLALFVASPHAPPPAPADQGPPFAAAAQRFANAAACASHLASIVAASPPPAYDRAVGPYVIAPGDTRAHRVRARDWGHEIEEFRCLDAVLSSRIWSHDMSGVKPFTIEAIRGMSFPAGPGA